MSHQSPVHFNDEISTLNEQLDRALHWKTKFQKLKWFHKTTKKKLHEEIQEQGLILGFLNYNNKF